MFSFYRYTAKGFPNFPTCNHYQGALLCRTLTAQGIRRFHSKFYAEKDKIYQDNFILKHLTMQAIKRRRPKNNKNAVKQVRAKYFIRNREKKMVPVCYNTFLKALNVSRAKTLHKPPLLYPAVNVGSIALHKGIIILVKCLRRKEEGTQLAIRL